MSILVLKILLGVAAAGYFLSAILFWCKKRVPAYIANGVAWVLNAVVVATNWVNNGYVPFVSMYQVLTFLGLCFTLANVYMVLVHKDEWVSPYFNLCSGVVMIGCCIMNATLIWHFVPALQSVYFVPHVFCYMLSYSLCAVASVLSVIWYFNKGNRENLDRGIHNLVLVAFPFMTAGLLLGAIWANQVWTEFWSWDAKENWALVTWVFYALYLHCRKYKSLQKFQYVFTILGIVALFMAFQGVNIFGASGEHSYS